jgi:hypothetical protein
MRFTNDIAVFGNRNFRGKCPRESVEQVTLFAEIRRRWPDTIGAIAIHPRNEQQLRGGQFSTMARSKAEGMQKGAPDCVIPGSPALLIELKRRDHTKSKWQDGQQEYLRAAQLCGATVCVALGWEGAMLAIEEWHARYVVTGMWCHCVRSAGLGGRHAGD